MNRHQNNLRSSGNPRWDYRVWWSKWWGQRRCPSCWLWFHGSYEFRPRAGGTVHTPVTWRHICLWPPHVPYRTRIKPEPPLRVAGRAGHQNRDYIVMPPEHPFWTRHKRHKRNDQRQKRKARKAWR